MTKLKLILALTAGLLIAYLTTSWLLALIGGVVTTIALLRRRTATQLLMVVDTESGKMTVQPPDRLTESYLKKRG